MSNKLCPFCGAEPELISNNRHDTNRLRYWVQCKECRQRGAIVATEAKAWAAWNRHFICLDKNGKKVYSGDSAETASYKGIVRRLGGIVIESEDGHLYHVWPHEIELIKEPDNSEILKK